MNLSGYQFTGPYNVDLSFKRDFGAVYVIVDDQPKILDIGQTKNINDRVQYHDRRPCWDQNKTGSLRLYVHINSSEQARIQIESYLRSRHNPVCGEK